MELYKSLKEKCNDIYESLYVDYQGQHLAEKIFQFTVIPFAVVGFLIGVILQRISYAYYGALAGFLIACIITVPPWPFFRRQKLVWLPASPTPAVAAPSGASKKKKTN